MSVMTEATVAATKARTDNTADSPVEKPKYERPKFGSSF